MRKYAFAVIVVAAIVASTITTVNIFAQSGGGPEFVYSTSPARTSPVPLEGATVSGNVYIFAQNYQSGGLTVTSMTFTLDNPPILSQVEANAPYDFRGGSVSTANPLVTSGLAEGQHTAFGSILYSDDSTVQFSATFTVNNTGTPVPPTATPTNTPVPPTATPTADEVVNVLLEGSLTNVAGGWRGTTNSSAVPTGKQLIITGIDGDVAFEGPLVIQDVLQSFLVMPQGEIFLGHFRPLDADPSASTARTNRIGLTRNDLMFRVGGGDSFAIAIEKFGVDSINGNLGQVEVTVMVSGILRPG